MKSRNSSNGVGNRSKEHKEENSGTAVPVSTDLSEVDAITTFCSMSMRTCAELTSQINGTTVSRTDVSYIASELSFVSNCLANALHGIRKNLTAHDTSLSTQLKAVIYELLSDTEEAARLQTLALSVLQHKLRFEPPKGKAH